jgi:pilus assembly protein CpaC
MARAHERGAAGRRGGQVGAKTAVRDPRRPAHLRADRVLTNGIINLRLTPSVRELDFTNAVLVSGFRIPALTKREARTTIELRDGQSFAIAGLLQTEGLRNIAQVPWIGSVPVLGSLFRSTSYQQHETDLVVIVTPHLVEPAAPGQRIATPLDESLSGNDVDLFLLGQSEVRKKRTEALLDDHKPPGPSGYIMPVGAR